MRGLRTPIVAVAVVQIALGLFVAHAYLGAHNTLYNNGRWISTKTTLEGGIIGAQSFVFNLQALARGRLNLNAWFGYQEVVSKRLFDPSAIELDLSVGRDGELTVQFGRTESRYLGLRVSDNPRFASALVVATPEGEFIHRTPLRPLRRARPGKSHRLRVDLASDANDGFTVSLNGKQLRRFRRPAERPMRLGFRGGARPAWVDNIRVIERDGSVWSEDFERPAHWRRVYAMGALGLPLLSLALFLILRRVTPVTDKLLLFNFLMFSIVLLALAALYLALVWRQTEFYPDADERLERQQAAYADAGTERMLERVRRDHPAEPAPGTVRILFLGSSQTRGSGATAAAHTITRQSERLLNERAGTERFECIDVAVRAYHLRDMRADFERHWVDSGAALAVLNAGYNDRDTPTATWKRDLWAIAGAARDAGIRMVLIPESSSVARPWPALQRIHTATRQIARRAELPVIEMHDHLLSRADDGFLWWDWVHLTSFGQRLFAERLVDELVRRGLVDTAPASDLD